MRTRTSLATVALALALGLVAGLVPGASAKAPASDRPELPELTGDYQREYPGMTTEQAIRAIDGQERRVELLEKLQVADPDGFGGAWYDPRTNTQHLNTVGAPAADRARGVADSFGLKTTLHPVRHSLRQLEALAQTINEGRHPQLGKQGVNRAAPDPRSNVVQVSLPANQLSAFGTLDPSIVVTKEAVETAEQELSPTVCTDRYHCGTPLRAGIVIWAGHAGNNRCSLGFTAAATDGSKWGVTAGHCGYLNGGSERLWGHGEQWIGPIRHGRFDHYEYVDDNGVRHYVNDGPIDIARILDESPYWKEGGYLYDAGAPNTPKPVGGYISNRGSIQEGDSVCLAAMHSVIGTACGLIIDPYHARSRMPVVGFDSCGGDSGGGWFYRTPAGEILAYGIQSAASNGNTCHAGGPEYSLFSAMPDVNAWWDSTTAATLRVETR